MKKMLCILMMICMLLMTVTAASAQTAAPVIPGLLRDVVAGKTFIARMEGYICDEEMEHITLYFQICEQESYKPEEIETLQVGDTILIGGDPFEIKEIGQDEFGYKFTGESYEIFLSKNKKNLYNAVTDTENRFYKNVFAIEVPVPAGLRFLDWSDPEAEAPVELTCKDLVTRYMNDEIHSTEDNTEITFDTDGNLVEVIYRYSPWN